MSDEHVDLSYDAEQDALAASVRGVVARWQAGVGDDDQGGHPHGLWKELAELGVFGLATPEGGGGAQEIAAVMEVLGEAAAPGPLVPTFMAAQLTGEPERSRIASGDSVASVGSPPLLPWAAVADVFVELALDEAWVARPAGDVEAVETLAGEPWGRVALERLAPVDDACRRRALVIGDVAVAAYLVGAAGHLVAITSQWLQDREQFGRPIGQFQSLAHPLADVAIRHAGRPCADSSRRVRGRQLGRRRSRDRGGDGAAVGDAGGGRRHVPRAPVVRRPRVHRRRAGGASRPTGPPSVVASARAGRGASARAGGNGPLTRSTKQRGNHTMEVDLTAPLEGLVYEKRDHIAYIRLNRPERGNALHASMIEPIKAIWAEVREDPWIRCTIVTGTGDRHFCTGADLGAVAARGGVKAGKGPLAEEVHWSPRHNRVWKPTICAVNGLVAGAGFHFVVDSDIVVASDQAAFVDTHTNVGMVGAVENIGLAKRLPLGSALRLTLCGRHYRMPAERAYQLGLVDELAPPDKVMETAEEIAGQICKNSPAAVTLSMQAVWSSVEMGYTNALEYGWALLRMHWDHPDFKEGPRAFVEKRDPVWTTGEEQAQEAEPAS